MATGQRKQRSLRVGVRWSSLLISSAVKAPARKRRPVQGWREAAETTTRRPGTDPETGQPSHVIASHVSHSPSYRTQRDAVWTYLPKSW
jgi:hypothetical protein